jgi:hypothetical protein
VTQTTSGASPLDLPDRRVFWMWVWTHIRPLVGWLLAALGATALFLGWYGVSGQALTARQLPYLVSGGLVGIALIVMAGVFLATEDWRRQLVRLEDLERKVDELHTLLTTDLPLTSPGPLSPHAAGVITVEPSTPIGRAGSVVALPSGSVFHRMGCTLVAGKSAIAAVDAATIARRGLAPCRICDPVPPAPVG